MAQAWDFDVAVVGGGPAGSSAASALVRRGHGVLVLERERFPRFHIGESLPWIHEILEKIGAGSGFTSRCCPSWEETGVHPGRCASGWACSSLWWPFSAFPRWRAGNIARQYPHRQSIPRPNL